jgi:DNA-binding response OmpR family regulator
MQVLHAATDADSINRASDGVPDVVLMDLMQVRRRRTGIIEWLRDHERLTTTPIVVYTALGTDSEEFVGGMRDGNAALYLAERATDGEVANRIGDLLAKVCPAA